MVKSPRTIKLNACVLLLARLLAGPSAAAFLPLVAQAGTFHVTSSADSGPGTLREAVAASNTTTGEQTVSLDVTSPITLTNNLLINKGLVLEGHGTTLDASDIYTFTLNNLYDYGGCQFKNLIIKCAPSTRSAIYAYSSNGNTISGCVISGAQYGFEGVFSDRNFIGGDRTLGQGNVFMANSGSGIDLSNSGANVICGNVIGLTPDQGATSGNGIGINLVYSGGTQIGNGTEAFANIIGGNQTGIKLNSSSGTCIWKNYIGITSGDAVCGNQGPGITSTYGQYIYLAGNVIAGNQSAEVELDGHVNSIVGNFIGTNKGGTAVVPGAADKIRLLMNNTAIGGKSPGQGNLIAGGDYGVNISEFATLIQMYGNTICGFSQQGIFYGRADKTAPVVTFANQTDVYGVSEVGDYVEVFTAEARPGAQGGSLKTLGSTSADGLGHWHVVLAAPPVTGYICGTATDAGYRTSAFSYNFPAGSGSVPPDPYQIPTPTATVSPTVTLSATITPTLTISPTRTPSLTITVTPSITWTATVSPTPTPSPLPTSTRTSTPSVTPITWISPGQIRVFPNPARDKVTFAYVVSGSMQVSVDVYQFSGERVAHLADFADGQNTLHTSVWHCQGVAPGIYLCRVVIKNDDNREVARRVIKVAILGK
jgi:parallel beta-helix repeat protein